MVRALVQLCWTMWPVLGWKKSWLTAPTTVTQQTATTMRMLVSTVQQLPVRYHNLILPYIRADTIITEDCSRKKDTS